MFRHSIKLFFQYIEPFIGFGFRSSPVFGTLDSELSKYMYKVHNNVFMALLLTAFLILADALLFNGGVFKKAFDTLDEGLGQRPYMYKLFSTAFVLSLIASFPSAFLYRKHIGIAVNFLGVQVQTGAFSAVAKFWLAVIVSALSIVLAIAIMFGAYLISIRFPTSLGVSDLSIFLPIQMYITIETFSMISILFTALIINFLPRNKRA